MRSMKLILGMLLVTAGINAAVAQETTAQERAQKQTESMTTNLELTEDQIPKVYEINLGVNLKNEAIRNNAEMSEESKKEAITGNNDGRKAMLKNVLTEEQYTKFEQREQIQMRRQEIKRVPKTITTE